MNTESARAAARLIDREIEAGRLPGGLFAAWKDGEEQLCVVRGMADIGAGRPLRRDSLFRIYSMTKPVTAVAAAILVEEGRLRPEDRVSDYLPEYAALDRLDGRGERVPCRRAMTIRQLLSMTSGLVYPDPDPAGAYMQRCFDGFHADNLAGRGPTTRQLARLVAGQPLAFEPGTGWRYGLSADIMGAIIEVVSGQRFGDFLSERVFGPLGMRETGFWVPPENAHRLVELYRDDGGALAPDPERHLGLTLCLTPPSFESGGAGLITSLDDYARFARMLAGGGALDGVRILSEATVRMFCEGMIAQTDYPAQMDWDSLQGCRYGWFMRSLSDPARSAWPGHPGEFGWDGWTGPYCSIDARRNRVLLFFTQVGGYSSFELMCALRGLFD